MIGNLRFVPAVSLVIGSVMPCAADDFLQEKLRLPVASAGSSGLEAFFV
jgi:hypothetical protein